LGYSARQNGLDPTLQLRQLVTLAKLGLITEVLDLVPDNLQGVNIKQIFSSHLQYIKITSGGQDNQRQAFQPSSS
jgi:hypothetical protein